MAEYWSSRINRRRLLALAGGAGALAALAACSSNNNKSNGNNAGVSKPATGGGTTASGGAAGSPAAAAGGIGAQINKLIGPGGKDAGQGQKIKMGALLALSGDGSYYGETMSKGIKLAIKQIIAAGGPEFQLTLKDHKSGDAAAGAAANREFGIDKTPLLLASYGDDIGAGLPATEQYKMVTLDGGGGTGLAFQKKPFFYGTRAITPDDPYAGVFMYIAQKLPNAKKVAQISWDIGAELNDTITNDLKKRCADAKLDLVANELTPIGATDYGATLARVKDKSPDIIFAAVYGTDTGYLMKQFVTSGMKAQVIGSEFIPPAAQIAGDAYSNYWFSYDFFDVANPPNPWSKLFIDTFKAEYNQDPDFYAANFYENTFTAWELVRRVLAKGGNPSDGAALNDALLANSTFKSVYGGDANTVGMSTIDAVTHTVTQRGMGLFQVKGGKPAPLAFFDLNAKGFRVVGS